MSSLLNQCAPEVAPATMTAIVRVESGGNPLAMWNNTTKQRVLPSTLQQAQAYLRQAMARGQRVDVGLAQVDTENFAAYGLSPANAFNACTNLRVGGQILSADYFRAVSLFGPGQVALFHAFEAYNSGTLWGDSSYANQILSVAGALIQVSAIGKPTHPGPESQPFPLYFWGSSGKAQSVRWTILP
nr:lytic transglycosylase domain-containing protein [Igneacidithiobacillus copahuensis]